MVITVDALLALTTTTLDDLKGQNITQFDVRGLSSVTDHMVIATGTSQRHVKALAEAVSSQAKQAGVEMPSLEGDMNCDWVLADLGDVVVHVMSAAARQFYDLESLWHPVLQDDASVTLLYDDQAEL